ncbi:MAG: AAA family ATPase, partial [Chitinophagales bacterium]
MKQVLKEKKNPNHSNKYIENFRVEHYFCIENIELQNLGNKKEVYFLGENGDGKTILLQALVLALKIQGIKNDTDKTELGTVLQSIYENQKLELYAIDPNGIEYKYDETEQRGTNYLENIYAYGSNRYRRNSLEFIDKEGYLSLFDDDQELLSPVEWLRIVKLEEEFSSLKLEKAISLLEDLLDKNVEINLRGSQVTFTERGTSILQFRQLSDGYKSVMTWVTDLVARLAKRQPTAELKDYEAIVLVDEIGLHLHPKWEARLVKKLRTWFPKIQFFFTTHSPTLILSASKDAIFYRIYKEKGVSKISEPFACSELSDLMLNGIVTSPLFDLENATMRSFDPQKDELDTTNHYHSHRIRKLVEEEVQQLK